MATGKSKNGWGVFRETDINPPQLPPPPTGLPVGPEQKWKVLFSGVLESTSRDLKKRSVKGRSIISGFSLSRILLPYNIWSYNPPNCERSKARGNQDALGLTLLLIGYKKKEARLCLLVI